MVGLRALGRDLARASDPRAGELLTVMKDAGRQAANPVAAAARGSVPHDSGTLAGDIRVTSARSGAAVRMGRSTVPYAGPVDFGGWPEGREYLPSGRYLFPAAQHLAMTVGRLYEQAIQRGLDSFAWTNETGNPEAVHD